MLEEAKKYNCRKQFKAQSQYCCKLASKIGMFDIFTCHMKRSINKKGYWNEELILERSKKYKTRVDFWGKEKAAYRAAQRLGILDKVCSHMVKPEQHRYWTKQRIFERAKQYNKKVKFQIESPGAYKAARKFRILKEICAHMDFKNDQLQNDAPGRICKKCKEFKIRELMCINSKSKSKMDTICKSCKAKYSKERLLKFPEKYNCNTANRRAMHKKASPKWMTADNKKEIESFYKEAKQKTSLLNVIHEVDHIVPIRSSKVCGLHVPWNLQVIPREQNRAKSNKIVDHV